MSTTTTIEAAATIVADPLQETARHAVAMAGPGQVVHQQAQPGPRSGANVLLSLIETAAMRPDMDLAKVNGLIDIYERWMAREAVQAYNDAMAGFRSEHVEILKGKLVDFPTRDRDGGPAGRVRYKHAELSDVIDAAGPALSRHGFTWRWDLKELQNKDIEVTCILSHRLGHFEKATLAGPVDTSGKKNALQQKTSTITMLQRATLKAVAGLAEKGDDNDGRGGSGPHDDHTEPGGAPERRPDPVRRSAAAKPAAKTVPKTDPATTKVNAGQVKYLEQQVKAMKLQPAAVKTLCDDLKIHGISLELTVAQFEQVKAELESLRDA